MTNTEPFDLLIPRSLPEALEMLAQPGRMPIAGGTDVIPLFRAGRLDAQFLVDLTRVHELSGIRDAEGWVHVGPLTTHAQVASSPLIRESAPLLAEAAASVGGEQTRHRGTIGGNLGNASPAADVGTALIAMQARILLRSCRGERELALDDFFLGPGQTSRRDDELISRISFRPLLPGAGSAFLKLGQRQALFIAIVSAAVVLEMAGDNITESRIALGSVAPTIIRAKRAEAALASRDQNMALFEQAGQLASEETHPIDDIRGSALYRRLMTAVLVRRALMIAQARAREARR